MRSSVSLLHFACRTRACVLLARLPLRPCLCTPCLYLVPFCASPFLSRPVCFSALCQQTKRWKKERVSLAGVGQQPSLSPSPLPPTPRSNPRSSAVACRPAPRPGPWVREAEACLHGVPSGQPPPSKVWEVARLNAAPFHPSPSREEGGTHACSSVLPRPRCPGPVRCPAVARRHALPAQHHQGAMMTNQLPIAQ